MKSNFFELGGNSLVAPSILLFYFVALQVQKGSFSMKSNFFELGGNSLRAGLINSKIRRATGADISGRRTGLRWFAL